MGNSTKRIIRLVWNGPFHIGKLSPPVSVGDVLLKVLETAWRLILAIVGLLLIIGLSLVAWIYVVEARRITCVVDVDTFWQDRVKYRIADIDAPEVSRPQCKAESNLARRSTLRLASLLNAGPYRIEAAGLDRYGRTLATVWRGRRSIGSQLVSEGLAREWGDRRGWC